MNRVKTIFTLILFLLGSGIAGGNVLARGFSGGGFHGGGGFHRSGGHGHVGVIISAPLFWGPDFYYPYPYYYFPDDSLSSSPPVYIEQGDEEAPPPQSNYWYYCANPQGYYPYVQQCPGGWQRVAPQPPPPPS
jgi:hypothetical protein